MLNNRNKTINSSNKEILTYELWLEEWKKRYCGECLAGIPNPENCYLCWQERKIGFSCSCCSKFIYHSEGKICAGLYETGSCFCSKCQNLIQKWLGKKECACKYSLAGYSKGHSIHSYKITINGLVKPFFRGNRLWIKLVCRSCERLIQSFKLGCECYLKQREHEHKYSKQQCLNCASGGYVRPLLDWDLRQKYQTYVQNWKEKAEIKAQTALKGQYKYDGVRYWAECSFCAGEVKGRQKDKEPLSRNKVGFWTENLKDERVICRECLRKKKLVKELRIKGTRKQMLYNYRRRGLI